MYSSIHSSQSFLSDCYVPGGVLSPGGLLQSIRKVKPLALVKLTH